MSFVTSGKKWHRAAAQKVADIEGLQAQQADLDFGRGLLSNIREIRIAQAQQQAYMSTGVQSSTAQGSLANIQSALGGEAGYAYDTSVRNEEIQYLADLAQRFSKKGAQMDKRAATNAKIMGAGAAILSYINPALGAIAAAGNAALISGMGGDSVAQKAALSTTLSGFNYAGAVRSLGSAFGGAGAVAESGGWAATASEAGAVIASESGGQALSAVGSGGALFGMNAGTAAAFNKAVGGFFGNMFPGDPKQQDLRLPGGRQSVVFNNYNPQGGSLMYRQGY